MVTLGLGAPPSDDRLSVSAESVNANGSRQSRSYPGDVRMTPGGLRRSRAWLATVVAYWVRATVVPVLLVGSHWPLVPMVGDMSMETNTPFTCLPSLFDTALRRRARVIAAATTVARRVVDSPRAPSGVVGSAC